MSRPVSSVQVAAACETLLAAGWTIAPPSWERIRLLSPSDVASVVGCGLTKAREIIQALPGSVRLPGGDLRCRPAELERWLESHRISG